MRDFINTRIFGHKVMFIRGSHSWELQISKFVLQLRHRDWKQFWGYGSTPRRFHHFIDPYGTR